MKKIEELDVTRHPVALSNAALSKINDNKLTMKDAIEVDEKRADVLTLRNKASVSSEQATVRDFVHNDHAYDLKYETVVLLEVNGYAYVLGFETEFEPSEQEGTNEA